VTVTLRPDLEEELTARAQAEGLTTEDFVNRELEKLVAREQASPELSAEERARILEEWIANHSVGGPPLSDYAVSRESIYKEREDAQL
jgi:L-fucose isomerase-like protein